MPTSCQRPNPSDPAVPSRHDEDDAHRGDEQRAKGGQWHRLAQKKGSVGSREKGMV